MKIVFTKQGMSVNNGELDARFTLASEADRMPGSFIKCNPENVNDLVAIISPMLTNEFRTNYWQRHKCLVWEGNEYNVAYCDGISVKGCGFHDRSTTPTTHTFPITPKKVVRLTLKAFDGNECPGEPYLSLEDIDVPENVITYKGDNGWVNDWAN